MSPSAIASLAKTSRAVEKSSSPCSVRMRPRAWRWNSGTLRLSSSALICRLTADWLRFSASPACVKVPASATAWKTPNLPQSIPRPPTASRRASAMAVLPCPCRDRTPPVRPPSLGCLQRSLGFLRCQKLLRLERGHAAHPCRGDRLAEDLVLDVAGGVDPRDRRRRRIGIRNEIALGIERELPLE